jgi:hypothetical protein
MADPVRSLAAQDLSSYHGLSFRRRRFLMSMALIALLFVAGFLSGAVNAIAGGGTFLTFGALTLAGVPPISANATSSIIQFPGYITSTLAYGKELKAMGRAAWILAAVSAVGALGGALFLISLSNPAFRAMVPWLLLGATLIFAAGPEAEAENQGGEPSGNATWSCPAGRHLGLRRFLWRRHGHHDAGIARPCQRRRISPSERAEEFPLDRDRCPSRSSSSSAQARFPGYTQRS